MRIGKTFLPQVALLILIALQMVGCGSDPIDLEGKDTAPGVTLELDLFSSGSKTRATIGEEEGVGNEIKINRVKVFFFRPDGSLQWKPTDDAVVLSAGNTKLKVKVPPSQWSDYTGVTNYTIYLLFNYPYEDIPEGITLQALQAKVLTADFNNNNYPDDFVMVGLVSKPINMQQTITGYNAGIVGVERVAAKLRPQYPILGTSGVIQQPESGGFAKYIIDEGNAMPVSVKLCNFQNKSYLDQPRNYYATSGAERKSSAFRAVQKSSTPLFYSYENQWADADAEDRTYFVYRIALRRETDAIGSGKYYYYKIPIAGNEKNNPTGYNKIQRNHLYDITPNITRLGSLGEDIPVEVNGNYQIKNWTTDVLTVEILDAHYFVVKEYNVIMANVNTYTVDFAATRPVSVEAISDVQYEEYTPFNPSTGTGGGKVIKTINPGGAGYPVVSVDNGAKKININASVPINYVPKTFRITLKDTGNPALKETIEVIQYPAQYVTGRVSELKDLVPGVYYSKYDDNQNNYNLFTVTSLAPSVYRLGDPTYVDEDGIIRTKEDAESNKLMSPKFVIASQRGIYNGLVRYRDRKYDTTNGNAADQDGDWYLRSARERCAVYAEGGYPVGTWRVPTQAELRFIDRIQDDSYSAVKGLLIGDKYWSAREAYYYDFRQNSSTLNPDNPTGWIQGDIRVLSRDPHTSYQGKAFYSSSGAFYNHYVERIYDSLKKTYTYYYDRYQTASFAGIRCVHDLY